MKFRRMFLVFALLVATLFIGAVATPSASAKGQHSSEATYTFAIGGVHADRMCAFRSFNGEYTLQNFAVDSNNQLIANGTISGTITGPSGCNVQPITITNQPQTLPVSSINATCTQLTVQFGVTGLQPDNYITLEGATFNITSDQTTNNFCKIAKDVQHNAPATKLAHDLDKALDLE